MKKLFFFLSIPTLLLACSKGTPPSPPPPPGQNDCILTKETTSLVGNEAFFQYGYEAGKFVKRVRFYVSETGRRWDSLMINGYSESIRHNPDGSSVRIRYLEQPGADPGNPPANLYEKLPARAEVYVKLADPAPGYPAPVIHSETYLFAYDSKKRLSQVEIDNLAPNAYDFLLTIGYDEHDNVRSLRYDRTTGPRDPIPVYICDSYDDKPSFRSTVKNWVFLSGQTFKYPETIFEDLSRHNPLVYAYGNDVVEKTYQYNEKGFPVTQVNKVKTSTQQYVYTRTFGYDCK